MTNSQTKQTKKNIPYSSPHSTPQQCDVTLIAGARHFGAHRIVLAAASAYLRDRLCTAEAAAASALTTTIKNQAARPRRHLTLMLPPHIDPAALHTLLDHLYTGRPAALRNATVRAVRVAADLLQLDAVRLQCDAFAAERRHNGIDGSSSASVGRAPPPPPALLLVFDVNAQRMHRYDVRDLMQPRTWTGGGIPADRTSVTTLPMPRAPFFGAVAVHAHRVHLFGDGVCTAWDAIADRWSPSATDVADAAHHLLAAAASSTRRSRCFGFAVAVLRHSVCLLGGRHDGEPVCNGAERYSPADGRWLPMRAMLEPRSRLGAAVVPQRGWLFAVGGEGADGRTLRSCERYDVATDRWQRCADMEVARCGAAVAAMGGRVYAAGGMRVAAAAAAAEPVFLRSVEVFEPVAGRWRRVRDMAEARCDAAAVVWAGRLWVIGGNVGAEAVGTVEVYDPVRDDWWVVTTAMEVVVRRPLVCVVETTTTAAVVRRDEVQQTAEGSWRTMADRWTGEEGHANNV